MFRFSNELDLEVLSSLRVADDVDVVVSLVDNGGSVAALFVEYFLDLNEIILVNAFLLLLLIFIFISYKKDIKNLIKILLLLLS